MISDIDVSYVLFLEAHFIPSPPMKNKLGTRTNKKDCARVGHSNAIGNLAHTAQ